MDIAETIADTVAPRLACSIQPKKLCLKRRDAETQRKNKNLAT